MKKSNIIRHGMLLGFVLMMSSCDLFDSTDQLPMYINIEDVELQTQAGQGVNSHSINAVAAFADGASIGVYIVPGSIPVLTSKDDLEFDILAVIKNNGIASNPIAYPFFKTKNYVYDFQEGTTETINPVFEYSETSKHIILADFETNNPFTINVDNDPEISFKRTTDAAYGDFAGRIILEGDKLEFAKTHFTKIERTAVFGGPVYLEMDYRNTVPFIVGILQETPGGLFVENYKVELTRQEEWNKVYVELTEFMADTQFDLFTVLLGSSRSNSDPGTIWIDNVKLVHF